MLDKSTKRIQILAIFISQTLENDFSCACNLYSFYYISNFTSSFQYSFQSLLYVCAQHLFWFFLNFFLMLQMNAISSNIVFNRYQYLKWFSQISANYRITLIMSFAVAVFIYLKSSRKTNLPPKPMSLLF